MRINQGHWRLKANRPIFHFGSHVHPGRRTVRAARSARLAAASILAALLAWAGPLAADAPDAFPAASRQSREEAIRAIPFDQLKPQVQDKLRDVISRPTIYRRMPVQVIDCDPDLYLYLVRYPEVVVNMWELMGVANVQIQRTGPFSFHTVDGAGTASNVELVYGTSDLHVLYAEGTYEGPVLKQPIKGRGVLLLRSTYTRGDDQRIHIRNSLDIFVQVDHVGVDLVARTLQPLIGKAADANFAESANFLSQVSQAAQTNGPGMQQLVTRLTNIDPAIRQQFSRVAAHVYHKAMLQETAGGGGDKVTR